MRITVKILALFILSFGMLCVHNTAQAAIAQDMKTIIVPINRSSLIELNAPMNEVLVSNPDIADVHAHSPYSLTVLGKRKGETNVRVLDNHGKVMREITVMVGHDLPAIRHALKTFFPDEQIGVELVNTRIALTGLVSSASVADQAVKIVEDFIHADGPNAAQSPPATSTTQVANPSTEILNMLKVASGQQVMLRVRVGEVNREALKILGVDLNAISRASGDGLVMLGTGSGMAPLLVADSGQPTVNPGEWWLPGGRRPSDLQGIIGGAWQPDGPDGNTVGGVLKALERDGLFKLLAEPNLVAISGEQAEFLAGGEIPIPVVQGSGTTANISIEYKPFGVAVSFKPQVLSEHRIRMAVMPEVSEISAENSVEISGFTIPSISTRRAKTTVELAPGESFMIAGLIKDQVRSNIDQLPGVKEIPVLGALFRSTEFQRNETELVIAVTPYIVDPVKGSDVKLPTDDFRASSQMEMFFYGALGSLSGDARRVSQTPPVEGPIGFMVD